MATVRISGKNYKAVKTQATRHLECPKPDRVFLVVDESIKLNTELEFIHTGNVFMLSGMHDWNYFDGVLQIYDLYGLTSMILLYEK